MVQGGWNPITPYVAFVWDSVMLFFQLMVLIALYRLAKNNATFVLLFASCIGEICVVFNYWLLYAQVVTGLIITPLTEVQNSTYVTYWARITGTAVSFMYIVISYNRNFWTIRLAIVIALLVWIISGVFAYYGTMFDDPRVLAVHNLDCICIFPANYTGEALLIDPAARGHATNYNAILGVSANITLVAYGLVFARYFVIILYRNLCLNRVETNETLTVSAMERQGHLRLLLICFVFMVIFPELVVFAFPYASYFPPAYLGIATDEMWQLSESSQSVFLFFLSSMVKKELPFRQSFYRVFSKASSNSAVTVTVNPNQMVRSVA